MKTNSELRLDARQAAAAPALGRRPDRPAVAVLAESAQVRDTLAEFLRRPGVETVALSTGDESRQRLLHLPPAVVLADESLLADEARTLYHELQRRKVLFVLFPTPAGGSEHARFCELQTLADEVAPLVQARLGGDLEDEGIVYRDLKMDRARMSVAVEGRPVQFTPTEFRILWALVEQPGFVLSRDQLLVACRESAAPGRGRTIDAHVRTMRRKLRRHGDVIETVRGIGYRLREYDWPGEER